MVDAEVHMETDNYCSKVHRNFQLQQQQRRSPGPWGVAQQQPSYLPTTIISTERPMKRVFVDLTGPYPTSGGGARYCMVMVDGCSNVGWTVFLANKSVGTLCQAFQAWHTTVKSTAPVHGPVEFGRFDNGSEFTNADFRELLVELGIKPEYTPVDGAKRNGRVERKLALIAEGAKAAWKAFPHRFPDLDFPAKARSWEAMWAEGFSWMNDCLNMTAQAHAMDKRCPWEKLYGKLPPFPILPFMMPGYRHRKRPNKMESKGEICFYLNSGNDHSSTTPKVLTEAGVCTYTADVTFGYSRRAWVGEVAASGEGASNVKVFEEEASSSSPTAAAPGGRASPVSMAGGAGGLQALPMGAGAPSSSPAATAPGGRASPVSTAGGTTGAPAAAGVGGATAGFGRVAPDSAAPGVTGGRAVPAFSAGGTAGAPAAAGFKGVAPDSAAPGVAGGRVFPAFLAEAAAGTPAAVGVGGASLAASVGGTDDTPDSAESAGRTTDVPAVSGTRGAATSVPVVAGDSGSRVFPTESAGMTAGATATATAETDVVVAKPVADGGVSPAASVGTAALGASESRGAALGALSGTGGSDFRAELVGTTADRTGGAMAITAAGGAAFPTVSVGGATDIPDTTIHAATSTVRPAPD